MRWFRNLKAKSGFGMSSTVEANDLCKASHKRIVTPDESFTLGKPYRSRRTWRDRFRLWLASLVQRLYLFLLPALYTGKSYDKVILLEMFKRGLLDSMEIIKFESTTDSTVLKKMEEFVASGDWETLVPPKKPKKEDVKVSYPLLGSRTLYDARSAPQPSRKESKAALQQTNMRRNRSWLGPVKVEEDKPKKAAKKKKVLKKKAAKKKKRKR